MAVALAHPERFGHVVALSGSLWWHPDGSSEGGTEQVARAPRGAARPSHGRALRGGPSGASDILASTRRLRATGEASGYDVTARDYAGGPDDLTRRGALGDALLALRQRVCPASVPRSDQTGLICSEISSLSK